MTNFRLFQTERVGKRWVENTVGKGGIARYENFSLSYEQFLLFSPVLPPDTLTKNPENPVQIEPGLLNYKSYLPFPHCSFQLLKK